MSVIVQLVTWPDGQRVRAYWAEDGTLGGAVRAKPEDARLPDGDYREDDQGRLTLVRPAPLGTVTHTRATRQDGPQIAP